MNISLTTSLREHVTFWWDDDDDVCFVLYNVTNMLSWILTVLAHWNDNPQKIDMSLHSDILSWFGANKVSSLFMHSGEASNSKCFDVTLTGYIFFICGHWPRYSFSGTRFKLRKCKKRKQHKCGLHRGHH